MKIEIDLSRLCDEKLAAYVREESERKGISYEQAVKQLIIEAEWEEPRKKGK